MKYRGPAKPIPTHVELISEKVERVFFLACLIFVALLIYFE